MTYIPSLVSFGIWSGSEKYDHLGQKSRHSKNNRDLAGFPARTLINLLIMHFSPWTVCRLTFLLLGADGGEQCEGADPGSGERGARSPGGGGAAPLGAGAQRGGAGGAVSPHPESPLEPGSGQPVANTLGPGAHADTHSRPTAGGERCVSIRMSGDHYGMYYSILVMDMTY